ncbi:MAG: LD-carboxypeptidase [Bacteroidales bacterium]|nr:LD-carboxypeptidase [Bacteroidales bacterium]
MKEKLTIMLVALMCFGATAEAQNKKMVRPESLKPGDKIAILSMASKPNDKYAKAGMKVLKEWGYTPVLSPNVNAKHGSFAGTPEDRAADMLWALRNPEIKAIMSTRGGYGSIQQLQQIPLDTLAKYPKWIIGYSDITSVHSAMVNAGVMSIHAHMCGYLYEQEVNKLFSDNPDAPDSCSLALRNILAGGVPHYEVAPHKYNHTGKASGMLVGGNLSVFCGMIGSEYDFLKNDNIILFIEDVSENTSSINRMIQQMKILGVLDKVKGIIIGQFTDYTPNSDFKKMEDMLAEELKGYKIPIAFNFPVGHVDENYPMIEGANVTLNVKKSCVTLTFDEK